MAKSAHEKLAEKKSPKTVVLDYNFGGDPVLADHIGRRQDRHEAAGGSRLDR
ncbi:MAG: hypothetical protein AAF683_08150 [Pseudomonadota bacterium]